MPVYYWDSLKKCIDDTVSITFDKLLWIQSIRFQELLK